MYLTISEIALNATLALRVAGAYASEGGTGQAQMWATNHNFEWAATPSWVEAWEAASIAAPGTGTGSPQDAITDEMILARVRELMAVPQPLPSFLDPDPSNAVAPVASASPLESSR